MRGVQALIGTGFDPMMQTDPYKCFVYTSFQERATKISHANTATLAKQHGAPQLSKICKTIAVRPPPAYRPHPTIFPCLPHKPGGLPFRRRGVSGVHCSHSGCTDMRSPLTVDMAVVTVTRCG